MKVEKTQFDAVLKALLSLPPMPMESLKGKRARKPPRKKKAKR